VIHKLEADGSPLSEESRLRYTAYNVAAIERHKKMKATKTGEAVSSSQPGTSSQTSASVLVVTKSGKCSTEKAPSEKKKAGVPVDPEEPMMLEAFAAVLAQRTLCVNMLFSIVV